jgi:hypothetical protein
MCLVLIPPAGLARLTSAKREKFMAGLESMEKDLEAVDPDWTENWQVGVLGRRLFRY